MSAGRSNGCLAQTQAAAVIKTIPSPDQMAYTIPAGILLSGNERSQNAATKQTTDTMLGRGYDRFSDSASERVATASARIDAARSK